MPRTERSIRAGFAVATILLATAFERAEAADAVDFNRDIRPILSNNCLGCHGPDEAERQAGLRLDQIDAATRAADSGRPAIVPGQPDKSELVARINAMDDAERMPPPDSNKKLTEEQRTLLTRWIAEGAQAKAHWSLVPPMRPAVPKVAEGAWPRNELDHFVLARLEREGLTPSPAADRLTLVRRLYLDLVGLLPTPDEADAFANDTRPDAYEALVDRLLDSPHYGERWARRWLDLARYADTNGYEKDRPRSVWPYRDWVIRSLNADLPYDQFTIQQIAGDLLPGAGLSQRIATGFHRNTMTNEEGGIDVEEFRFYSVVDRVNTTAAVWLGLTVGCAQCHNHKFDPISQRDYYGLFALLNNADEPELDVPQPEISAARAEIESQIASLTTQRDSKLDPARLAAWVDETARAARPWTAVAPTSAVSQNHATLSVLTDQSVLASGDKPNQDVYVVELTSPLERVTGIRLEVLPHESLPAGGPGRAPTFSDGDFMLGEFSAAVVYPSQSDDDKSAKTLTLKGATQSYAGDKTSAEQSIDGDLDTGWTIKGRAGQAHQAVFPLAEPLNRAAGARLRITMEQRYIHQMTLGRFRLALTSVDAPAAASISAEVEATLVKSAAERTADELAAVREHYLSIAPELADENKRLAELRKSLPAQPTTLVMQERSAQHQRVTHLHHRGEFLSPRDEVAAAAPAVLHALPAGAKADRLALARWLVDPANPLVARVTMNRHWQYLFGRGLVRTSEDFGSRGEPPSHPELLDYLAVEFVARGWSLKQMHRLIVTSATYRQTSNASEALRQCDPQNVLLARGPRVRVDAEVVRDAALAASGQLTTKLGGRSVYPPQPSGVTELAYGATSWPTSVGPDRYRRALYTFIKRASPYAAIMTFDGPSGENCVVRRERSNTPLQALTLLNDTVYVEAAQALAARTLADEATTTSERARLLMRRCLTREPAADELAEVAAFYDAQLARMRAGALDPRSIVGKDAAADQLAELAAWTLTARAVLNLDEFVTNQ